MVLSTASEGPVDQREDSKAVFLVFARYIHRPQLATAIIRVQVGDLLRESFALSAVGKHLKGSGYLPKSGTDGLFDSVNNEATNTRLPWHSYKA